MMKTYLLDSTTISFLLEKNKQVIGKINQALKDESSILMSAVVFYEVARGLYHEDTKKQFKALESLTDLFSWCDLKKSTWDLGAQLWAKCRKQGTPTCDPKRLDQDVLIAAQAKENNAIVVTHNKRHFDFLGVECETW